MKLEEKLLQTHLTREKFVIQTDNNTDVYFRRSQTSRICTTRWRNLCLELNPFDGADLVNLYQEAGACFHCVNKATHISRTDCYVYILYSIFFLLCVILIVCRGVSRF